MKPEKRDFDYERVPMDDFVQGIIEDIAYDPQHKTSFKGEEKIRSCVRFKFKIEGCEYGHYSRWMTFSYGEQTNLYNKYLVPLVADAQPDMDFDLDHLKGMKVKMLWAEKNKFQFVETIRPADGKKLRATGDTASISESFEPDELKPDDSVPF